MGRYLGQHFLVNKSAIKKIIAALEIKAGDTIIEIGPGRGALTIPLAKKCHELNCKIIAIEKDPILAEQLRKNFQFLISNFQTNSKAQIPKLEIVKGDALKILPEITKRYTLYPKPYKLAGNIPYYITGHLLRVLGELGNKPSLIVFTIQKEVAERICAKPGKMNLLAASVQFWAEPRIIARLKSKDFLPPPKVDSAVIKLITRIHTDKNRINADKYYKLIRAVFKQPRKTLVNNLSKGLKIDKTKILQLLEKMGYNENSRPQDLNIQNLLTLSKVLW